MCLLPQAPSRVWNPWHQGQHAGRPSKRDGVLLQLPGPPGEVHPYLHTQEFPKCHRAHATVGQGPVRRNVHTGKDKKLFSAAHFSLQKTPQNMIFSTVD